MPIIARVKKAAEDAEHPDLLFYCPGCCCGHGVWVETANPRSGARWTFNGSLEKPTFAPSIIVTREFPLGHGVPPKVERCHSFVTDGQIQFLSDCTHDLAGKTVPLPEL